MPHSILPINRLNPAPSRSPRTHPAALTRNPCSRNRKQRLQPAPTGLRNGAFFQLFAAGSTLQPMIKRAGEHILRCPEELHVGIKQRADM